MFSVFRLCPSAVVSILKSTLLLLGIFCGGKASPISENDASGVPPISSGFNAANTAMRDRSAVGNDRAGSPLSQEPPAGAAAVPQGWVALTLTLDEGARTKIVMIRDGAKEPEVRLYGEAGGGIRGSEGPAEYKVVC